MAYLITQIVFCLLITALISFNIGWLLRGLRDRDQITFQKTSEISDTSVTNNLPSPSVIMKEEVTEPKTRAPTISHNIEKIQGIGKSMGNSLRNIGVKTTIDLIKKCRSEKGFQQVLSTTQIPDAVAIQWVSMADLMRVPDVDGQSAKLMEDSEIKSVHDLAKSNANELIEKMKTINQNDQKILIPDIYRVSNWICDAKSLMKRV